MQINYFYLRLGMLPCWPDHDTMRDTMPATFKEHYPRTTVILDATEYPANPYKNKHILHAVCELYVSSAHIICRCSL